MSAARDALREAAAAERARYCKPFVEGPRAGTRTPVGSDDLLQIFERRTALLAEADERLHLQIVRDIA